MGRARAMARQLSEQLEREVSAEELLKAQSNPQPPAVNRIAPPAPHVPPAVPYVPPPAAYVEPHAGHDECADPPAPPHAEYHPPSTVPTTPPSND